MFMSNINTRRMTVYLSTELPLSTHSSNILVMVHCRTRKLPEYLKPKAVNIGTKILIFLRAYTGRLYY